MSVEVSTAHVKQYSANVFHLSQQKGSRLRPGVRIESQKGKSAFWDRIGKATARRRTTRHGDTVLADTPHSRRMVSLVDYDYADLVDVEDLEKLLMDPTGPYTEAAVWALGRSMDEEIITAASGTAYGGEEGTTSVVLPNAQKLVATDGVSTDGTNLNVLTLRRTKKKLDAADVDPSIRRYFALTSSQLEALLGETEVTSSDFNTIKALVQGEINTFLGFEFIRTELLNRPAAAITFVRATGELGAGDTLAQATARSCIAWAKDGLLLALGRDVMSRVSERPDKNHATQVFASMGIGSTRMEEEKVVEVNCKES